MDANATTQIITAVCQSRVYCSGSDRQRLLTDSLAIFPPSLHPVRSVQLRLSTKGAAFQFCVCHCLSGKRPSAFSSVIFAMVSQTTSQQY